ncbi:sigma-70 family RNA polymerase sigma factor [Pseudomonas typographi]|uniref:Sigma-70 family RNA polymerase sigma factor n=1 Tax=Pseudomonas typographi TaxID=2715964 RepID=A0ABR7Z3W2_9PSED|nr:sigma-70 family RNA polymerase sigma factor [Pseudomonas typographi]MBD1586588.1 sigma-70 family RNA polymerase sigma factor [Pseudomonas typographi]MBD1600089.1 sigma-70 family RNA polymerase sigma factor [Pseudomonas typographi]
MSRHPHYSFMAALFAQHYPWLRARVTRVMGCSFSGEDIAAETFVRVLGLRDPQAIREPRALLTTIAKRLMLDNWRRGDLEKAYLETLKATPENTWPSPEEQAVLTEALLALDRLLDGLPGVGKAVFVQSCLGGLTYEQIGRELGISKSRVQQHMEQAIARCMTVMAP